MILYFRANSDVQNMVLVSVKSLVSFKRNNRFKEIPKKWKLLAIFFCLVGITAGIWGYRLYNEIFRVNVIKSDLFLVPTGSSFEQVFDLLKQGGFLKNPASFEWVASKKNYRNRVLPGAYKVKNGWCNNQLVNLLRSGAQTPVKVTFNNIRFREELAGRLSHYLEPDSVAFLTAFNNEKITSNLGFSKESFPMIIIPNTYQFYWNTTPQKFIERMKHEYDRFWNGERINKSTDLGLTPLQIVTIASIVQEETNKNDEKACIAGVYINRLKRGWPLQADPTVKFAMGDFLVKRVLTKNLSIDSPYNTYKYVGLPPGPINFPDSATVDAVLNAENHNYMYFCAKEDFSGYHNFARSLPEHNRNAAKYQNALNKVKIWK